MQIKLMQCHITGAIQIKLNEPLRCKINTTHNKFKSLIKTRSFEWDFDTKVWEGSVEAIEDILTDVKSMAIMRCFIECTPEQGLSFLDADGKDLEMDEWLEWTKTFDITKVAKKDFKDIPKANFNDEASSSQQSTPLKRKFEGPPRAGKKSGPE